MSSISNLRDKITAIANALRNKLGTEDEMTLDEMAAAINNMEDPPLQEKTITENGEVTADEGYYGLSKVTVNVAASGGSNEVQIENGFTVNFYDINNELLETHSAKFGMWIDKPLSYNADTWQNESGYINTFPLTVTKDMGEMVYNLFAHREERCEDILYNYFEIDRGEYPYIMITVQGGASYGWTHFWIYFSATKHSVSSDGFGATAGLRGQYAASSGTLDYDIMNATKYIVQNVTELTEHTGYGGSGSSYIGIYGNFENENLDGRLDEIVYSE